ncbi:winged helix-turn-helix domain-containing protein [Belnapia moabensis]|uniref:winged helix-turn-helix domain-containing protein n=1 Tax=Belnapia moabensis TaxID=365533 RepID=UPI001B804912|nr:winged helix-turn-helix domain-containing protein [Belnapia moabensis]
MPDAMSHLAKIGPCPQLSGQGSAAHGRVLVVDDNPESRGILLRYLADRQFPAVGTTGNDLARRLERASFSFVVVDVRATHGDGVELLRQIRARSEVPVILVAGQICNDLDRIVCLELGADDVLRAPLNLRELIARMRATLRRQEAGRRAVAAGPRGGYRFDGWVLDQRTRTLKNPAGQTVYVTKTEYALLVALLETPRRPLARAQLMRATRAHEDIHDRTIDAQVLRLRRKIEADPAAPQMIRTGRGRGYMLDASVETLP